MTQDPDGLVYGWGAVDFAGGTVVHINAGVAGLVGMFFAGKRIGFLKEMMPPLAHLDLEWRWPPVGRLVGFNAGSNLDASGGAAIAMMNTFVAPAAAC